MPSFVTVKLPAAGPLPTMCRINNAAGYAAGTTAAMTTDDNLPAGDVTTVAIEDNAEFYVEDPAQLAYTLAVARGFILTAANTSGVEVSEDGRGNLTYTFWDMS